MDEQNTVKSPRVPENPYYKDEYEAFIAMTEKGVPVDSWRNVAADFGVSDDTLQTWKKTPRYQQARKKVLDEVIANLKRAGANDWRMWDRYAKLLNIDAVERHDITSGGKAIPILGGASVEAVEREIEKKKREESNA